MRNRIITMFLVIVLGCMKLPEQPPLTSYEEAYFKELTQECKCKVEREIDPSIHKNNVGSKNLGYYLIELGGISCKSLENKDSLKKVGDGIAKKLHYSVLGDNFNYPYKEITVSYYCRIDTINYRSQYFDYTIEELEK